MYVEEWLDSLPYIDFQSTIRLLYSGMQASNNVPMKSVQRMELVSLYHRPYQYYLDTQIRAGTRQALHTMDTMQNQLNGMKLLSAQLARACRLAMDEALSHKSLWGQNKYPLHAILMAMTYLSHTLVFSFLEYAPTPQKVWEGLNFLYRFAENVNQQNSGIKLIGGGKTGNNSTIEHVFKRVLLISLADPYHLPFGAVWEIYDQLDDWADHARLQPFGPVEAAEGCFVINLDKDQGPLPYLKFNTANATNNHRLLGTAGLQEVIQQHIAQAGADRSRDNKLSLSPFYADYLLRVIGKAWSTPPKRYFPRKTRDGQLNLAHGLNATYFYLNGEREFKIRIVDNQDEELAGNYTNFIPLGMDTPHYTKETWDLVDTSGGGISVSLKDRPANSLRVGDLAGFSLDEKNLARQTFRVGILRWLVRRGNGYKAGLQIINQPVYPAAIRARMGNLAEREFRRAILSGNPDKQKELFVIASKGLFKPDRELEIKYRGKDYQARITNLLESTAFFEQFDVELK